MTEFGEWSIKCDRELAKKCLDYAYKYKEKYPNDTTHFNTLMQDVTWFEEKANHYYEQVKMLKDKGYQLLPGE